MKLYSVQYLRGIAALLVLLTHALLHPLPREVPGYVRIGSLGVTLFFVISGFIMVLISGAGPFDRWRFYRRRILRVVPLYWLATLAVAAVAIVAPTVLRNTSFDIGRLVMSLLFIPHFRADGATVPLLKLGWSLNVEMFFYACFGVFAFLRAARRVAVLSAIFITLAALGQAVRFDSAILQVYTLWDLTSFTLGMWAGLATLRGWRVGGGTAGIAVVALAGAGLIGAGFVVAPGRMVNALTVSLHAIGSTLLLLSALAAEPRLPRWRLPTLIGDASYSIYLVHMYFVGAAVVVMHRLFPDAPVVWTTLAGLVSGGIAGIAAHLLVERPLLAATHRPARRPATPDALPTDGTPPALIGDRAQ